MPNYWKATLLQYCGLLCHNVFATEAENLLKAIRHNSRAKYFECGPHKAILNCLGFYKQVTSCHSDGLQFIFVTAHTFIKSQNAVKFRRRRRDKTNEPSNHSPKDETNHTNDHLARELMTLEAGLQGNRSAKKPTKYLNSQPVSHRNIRILSLRPTNGPT